LGKSTIFLDEDGPGEAREECPANNPSSIDCDNREGGSVMGPAEGSDSHHGLKVKEGDTGIVLLFQRQATLEMKGKIGSCQKGQKTRGPWVGNAKSG